MADDWEENDWESESFQPVLPAATKSPEAATKPVTADVDASKFADEDKELEEEKKHAVPASQVRGSWRGGAVHCSAVNARRWSSREVAAPCVSTAQHLLQRARSSLLPRRTPFTMKRVRAGAQRGRSASPRSPRAAVAVQPKKKEEKKYLKEVGPIDQPLADPVAEKLRRQR